jgi:pimeloyl-ACP methyl ester carboxylesterase
MPFATNAIDHCGVFYIDSGGSGVPVVFLSGFAGTAEGFQSWGLASALGPEFRKIFVDHRGHGESSKPHRREAHAISLRVGDVVAVLDELEIQRAHFIGASWGARLGYGIGGLAQERVLTLTLAGQEPYPMNPDGPVVRAVTHAMLRAPNEGMKRLVEAFEGVWNTTLPQPVRAQIATCDAQAMSAAWHAALDEGAVATNLRNWECPCLIWAGTEDWDFFDGSKRAASEIPGAKFLALNGFNHLEAHGAFDLVLLEVRQHLLVHDS